jgi:hypothetical protein
VVRIVWWDSEQLHGFHVFADSEQCILGHNDGLAQLFKGATVVDNPLHHLGARDVCEASTFPAKNALGHNTDEAQCQQNATASLCAEVWRTCIVQHNCLWQ